MKISFSSIKIENFKNINFLELNFSGKKTLIYGANEAGKTTIADAISWCLFGKNSLGESQFNFIPIGNESASASVTLAIDIEKEKFADHIIIQRVNQAKKNKSNEFTGAYQTVCYVNRLKVGIKEFENWIKTHICDPDIFRLISDVRYFTENISPSGNERPWEVQRRFIFSISGIKSDYEFAKSKKRFQPMLEGLERYDTANQYLNFLRAEEKRIVSEIKEKEFEISMFQADLKPDESNEYLESQISALQDKRDSLKASIEENRKEMLQCRNKEIEELQDKLDKKMNDFRENQNEYSRKGSELSRKRKELSDNSTDVHCELVSAQYDLKRANDAYNNIQIQCPTCGQYIPTEVIEEEKEKLLSEIEILKSCVDSIRNREEDVLAELSAVESEISRLRAPELPDELRELQNEILKKSSIEFPSDESLVSDLNELDQKLTKLLERKNLAKNNNEIKAKIDELEKELRSKLDLKSENSRFIDLCRDFIDAKCKYAEKKVNDLFKGIEFKMFRKNKTNDEVRECCDIFWNGVPYSSLSYSTKFVVSMNIAFTFQKVYNIFMPIIVDNAESIDLDFDIPVQSIFLVKRDSACPECKSFVGRKGSDGFWACNNCGRKFKKEIEIEGE